jgi:hypothetical protein
MNFHQLKYCLLALALAGCANNNVGIDSAGVASTSKPKAIVVSDFVVAAEVPAIDRGFSARQESNGANYPILERRQRALERVNDEIIATVVANLREAGLEAVPASAEGALKAGALHLSGRMHPPEDGKRIPVTQLGFGTGRGRVVADMTLTRNGLGKHGLLNFSVEPQSNRKATKSTARDEAIASLLSAQGAAAEKLSPDVEAQARRLGDAIAGRIVSYAKEQGWTIKADAIEADASEAPKPKKRAEKPKKEPTT